MMLVGESLGTRLVRKYSILYMYCDVHSISPLLYRVSAQVYNVKEDYVRLAEALEKEINAAQTAVACSTPNTV